MDSYDIAAEAKDLAKRLHNEMKALRITRVDIETIRAVVAGYCVGSGAVINSQQLEDFESATLRKFVEGCA